MKTKHIIGVAMLALVNTHLFAASLQSLDLSQKDQIDMHLTVYNSFAVVKDSRRVDLPKGDLLLEFEGVAQTLEPSSVAVSSLTSGSRKNDFRVREQSYQYDLLNRNSLLETYIGRKLKYSRTLLQGDSFEKILREGILLSTNPEIVDFGDEIEIAPEGVISLPDVPEGLTLSPTLVWLVENGRSGEQVLQAQYIAEAVGWRADYVLTLDQKSSLLNLTSWATVRNDSGIAYQNATIRLIAGSVNKASAQHPQPERMMMSRMAASDSAGVTVSETNAYQAFDLPLKATLLNHETKQLEFMRADKVGFDQTFHLRNQVATYQNARTEEPAVTTELSFFNSKKNSLGVPLAAGIARTYAANGDLLGATQMSATPKGQKVVLSLGTAFDLTAKRVQKAFTRLSDRSFDITYEVAIANAREKPTMVLVSERMQGDWQIQESSDSYQRQNNQEAQFLVEIPGNGSKTLTYRVRVRN